MSRQPLVLLVSGDRLAAVPTANGLVGYGYEVLLPSTMEEAGHLLCTTRRIRVLVVDTDLKVIYTSRIPFRLGDAEKVSGAPCLRTPYRPHQLAGVISQLVRRIETEEAEAYAA